ncbi:hypothetical protein C8J56DRAFT_1081592 [Mycena floridula]|nr:hypothetical protein C8J56DRAFT_1081592 [Mycena floridula]
MSSATSSDESDASMTGNVTLEDIGLSSRQLSQGPGHRMLDLVDRLRSTGSVYACFSFKVFGLVLLSCALTESKSILTFLRLRSSAPKVLENLSLSSPSLESPYLEPLGLVHGSLPYRIRITDLQGQTLGQVRNESFGSVIHDKATVDDRIRRAQRAILNPSIPASKFLSGDDEDPANPELTFTPSYISLQISGPDVADLSFCDLPGIASRGNETDIKLIRSLVPSYISKASCVILLTVAWERSFKVAIIRPIVDQLFYQLFINW